MLLQLRKQLPSNQQMEKWLLKINRNKIDILNKFMFQPLRDTDDPLKLQRQKDNIPVHLEKDVWRVHHVPVNVVSMHDLKSHPEGGSLDS